MSDRTRVGTLVLIASALAAALATPATGDNVYSYGSVIAAGGAT